MTRILRNIFIFSLLLYLFSTAYTRLRDSHSRLNLFDALVYSLPLDAFPLKYIEGKDDVSIQIGALLSFQVVELLKNNPEYFSNFYGGGALKKNKMEEADYLVIRYKNTDYTSNWGDIKCYCSCFPYPIVQFISMPSEMKEYYNIVLPYPDLPEGKSQKSCIFSVRWKNFWGHP